MEKPEQPDWCDIYTILEESERLRIPPRVLFLYPDSANVKYFTED